MQNSHKVENQVHGFVISKALILSEKVKVAHYQNQFNLFNRARDPGCGSQAGLNQAVLDIQHPAVKVKCPHTQACAAKIHPDDDRGKNQAHPFNLLPRRPSGR